MRDLACNQAYNANSQLPIVGSAVICESLQSDEQPVDIAMYATWNKKFCVVCLVCCEVELCVMFNIWCIQSL